MKTAEPTIRLDRIAERMRAMGIDSDRELARRADVDNATVSVLRQGNRPNIAALTLAKIADALLCSTSYLLGETDWPTAAGRKLPAYGEDVLRIMASLPDSRRGELLDMAQVIAAHNQRRAAWDEAAAELVRLVGDEEAARLLAQVIAAARTGDESSIGGELPAPALHNRS